MSKGGSIVKFVDVSFEYGPDRPILNEANFTVRRGSKMTLMGQNGAGKSTLFKILTDELEPEDGKINLAHNLSIATAKQVIPREQMTATVREFFESQFDEKVYDIDPKIDAILDVVNLVADKDKQLKDFSGGQQARLLLASALIQEPDLLLLDEPTNNLDTDGIEHLTQFLKDYTKTCVVISHDADFLNAFTHGVLYLDVFTGKVEQYDGNYYDVLEEVVARVEKEKRANAQIDKKIQANKDKANFFANKGGRMRLLAKRMREEATELDDNRTDVRKDDKPIRPFTIPMQEDLGGEILKIDSYTIFKGGKIKEKKAKIALRRGDHLLLKGPNGMGKSTLLERLADGSAEGATIADGVKVGYYRQDFSNLDFNDSVFATLAKVMEKVVEQDLRSVAAGFLLGKEHINSKVGDLSEGQKGLVAFAQLALLKPGLLILDEPTNHINFRHLPIIADALSAYKGPMILVSHMDEFVDQVHIDDTLDLDK